MGKSSKRAPVRRRKSTSSKKRASGTVLSSGDGSGKMAMSLSGYTQQLPAGSKIQKIYAYLVYQWALNNGLTPPTRAELLGYLNASASPWKLQAVIVSPPFGWEDQLDFYLAKNIIEASDSLRAILPAGTTAQTNQFEQAIICCGLDYF